MEKSLEAQALNIGMAVLLIEHELNHRHLKMKLRTRGITHILTSRNLDTLILELLNLDDGTEEALPRYDTIMNKHATHLTVPSDTQVTPAHQACLELITPRKQKTK